MKPRPLSNPANRFAKTTVEYEAEAEARTNVEIIDDATKNILSHNDSPDVGFDWSVNPYRGCVHACAYCFARPTHEYLGLGAGTDFDTKIHVKRRAAELLREAFDRPSWKGELVVFSGVTDCYQPLESSLGLTRECLEVCAEYRNPVAIITKSPLVERDIDVLQELTRTARVSVRMSVPFFDPEKARAIEPWVATPARRLQTVETLVKAGISVGVNVAPIIPGLSDEEMPRILEAARNAGARKASYVLLRLPGAVKAVFEERIRATMPERAERILHRIRETRGGELYDFRFGIRGKGTGTYAESLAQLFSMQTKRLGMNEECMGWDDAETTFVRPPKRGEQMGLGW